MSMRYFGIRLPRCPAINHTQLQLRHSAATVKSERGSKMTFPSTKLKPESGANRIRSADDAYSFVLHMRLSDQNKPHWQMARQALNNVCASDAGEIRAWRTFREAAAAEGWLVE
jgi:phage FluMu protein Com